MPFKVELEISSKAGRTLWTKAISAFNTISDGFKIDIRQGTESGFDDQGRKCYSEVVFTSVNKTQTTVLSTAFQRSFFKKFNIEGEISDRGSSTGRSQNIQNYAKRFTLIVNSKDMNILFKDCAEDSVNWKIFMLCGDEVTHMIYSNKLFVEFLTKSDMKKKYSISFRPAAVNYDNRVEYIYLKTLEYQRRVDVGDADKEVELSGGEEVDLWDGDEEERVHRIAMSTVIFKRFLQMFPTMLEDFRIEVDPAAGVISFKGYNRQQIISKIETINKPMTLSIQMRLSQIVYNNFRGNAGDNSNKIEVSFRLKNFKTFLQIISGNLSDFNEDAKDSRRLKSVSKYEEGFVAENGDNICDIMFSKSGYPIIFERRYFIEGDNELKECCSVSLTEATDGESKKIFLENTVHNILNNKLADIGHVAVGAGGQDRLRSGTMAHQGVQEPLFVADEEEGESEKELGYEGGMDVFELGGVDVSDPVDKQAEVEKLNRLFWDNERFHQTKVVSKADDGRGGDGGDGGDEGRGGDYLGPTQEVHVKGIFD